MRNVSFLFSTIKSGYLYRKNLVKIFSNIYFIKILNLLYNEGLINGYFLDVSLNKLIIFLKYYYNKPLIASFKYISSNTARQYNTLKQLKNKLNFGVNDILIINTNQGLLTSRDVIFNNLGGEIICIITN